jgi:tetraacyldisaccharide 4'-kinase
MNRLLAPIGWMYGGVMALRNSAYDAGWFQTTKVGVPVIAVGNLTAGGTGKTPLVEYIIGMLIAAGRSPAMVSRGYGRSTRGVLIVSRRGEILARYPQSGDEPAQIAMKFPGASVVVGERRVDAGRMAIEQCGADVIVLDDAFQHRAIARDLNILVLESGRDIGREGVIPAGRLREQSSGMARADLIGFSGNRQGGVPSWATRLVPAANAFSYCQRITGLISLDGQEMEAPGLRVFVFSGIGNPEGFERSLEEAGVVVAGKRRFRDHHAYSDADLRSLCDAAAALGVTTVVTSEKDAVRLGGSRIFRERGLTPARSRSAIDILTGGDLLKSAVLGMCNTRGAHGGNSWGAR